MTTNNDGPQWLTVKEVAEELQVASMTVYRLIKTNELPALRAGARSLRISREHLEAFIAQQTGQTPSQAPPAAQQPPGSPEDGEEQTVAAFLFEDSPPLLPTPRNYLTDPATHRRIKAAAAQGAREAMDLAKGHGTQVSRAVVERAAEAALGHLMESLGAAADAGEQP